MAEFTITDFRLSLLNIPASGINRGFTVTGDEGATFSLEIKNGSNYYNFTTKLFQATKSRLSNKQIPKGPYSGSINFPSVTSNTQYDVYLWAEPGTKHRSYSEVRFADNSLDLNSSAGSNSLLLQKVIYQYTDLTLTLNNFSVSGNIAAGGSATANDTISIPRNEEPLGRVAFKTVSETTSAAACFQIIKQPEQSDIITYKTPTIGTAVALPMENIYPTERAAFTGDDTNGAVSGTVVRMDNTDLSAVIAVGDKVTAPTTTGTVDGAIADGADVVMDQNVDTIMAVGDEITGLGVLYQGLTVTAVNVDGNAKKFTASAATQWFNDGSLTFSNEMNRELTTVTVVETSGVATDFTLSASRRIIDNLRLIFTPQKNYRWTLNNIIGISESMFITPSTNMETNTSISEYRNTTTVFEGTEQETTVQTGSAFPALEKTGTPTVTNGIVVTQPGNIIFNKQQILLLAGDSLKIGGYGEDQIYNVSGYKVKFHNLKMELTPITTTTTSSTVGSSSTSVVVASRNGILDNISYVSGIGIDNSSAIPYVASGAGAVSGAGTIVLSAAQELESGITLTFSGAGQIATITGEIEILKHGTSDLTLRFDIDKLLSIT